MQSRNTKQDFLKSALSNKVLPIYYAYYFQYIVSYSPLSLIHMNIQIMRSLYCYKYLVSFTAWWISVVAYGNKHKQDTSNLLEKVLLPSTYRTYLHLARNNTVIVVHFSQRELLPTFLRDMLVGIVRSIIKQIDTEHDTARNTDVCVDFPCLFLELKMYVLIGIYHTQ